MVYCMTYRKEARHIEFVSRQLRRQRLAGAGRGGGGLRERFVQFWRRMLPGLRRRDGRGDANRESDWRQPTLF